MIIISQKKLNNNNRKQLITETCDEIIHGVQLSGSKTYKCVHFISRKTHFDLRTLSCRYSIVIMK